MAPSKDETFTDKLFRKKKIPADMLETPLNRYLQTWHLVFFGVGCAMGGDLWVTAGYVAGEYAGPSAWISSVIAGVAALLNALCYAELCTKLPKAGGAYLFTYIVVGEFFAWLIGWVQIIGDLAEITYLQSGVTEAMDWIAGGAITDWLGNLVSWWPTSISFLKTYPDLMSASVIMLLLIAVCFGIEVFAKLNNVITVLNLSTTLIVAVIGFMYADWDYWFNVSGGYVPYGWGSVFSGAAIAFNSYCPLDGIAQAAEEAETPGKSIPRASYIAMLSIMLVNSAAMAALTLIVPYYEVSYSETYQVAFASVGLTWVSYLVCAAVTFAACNSNICIITAKARQIYAIVSDGLFFEWFGKIDKRTRSPLNAAVTCSIMAALIAMTVELEILMDIASLGTNIAFSTATILVIILRYTGTPEYPFPIDDDNKENEKAGYLKDSVSKCCKSTVGPGYLMIIIILGMAMMSVGLWDESDTYIVLILAVPGALVCLGAFLKLYQLRQNMFNEVYRMPSVPVLPLLALAINISLIVTFEYIVWTITGVWALIGCIIYFTYGVHHSKNKPGAGAEGYQAVDGDSGDKDKEKNEAIEAPPEDVKSEDQEA